MFHKQSILLGAHLCRIAKSTRARNQTDWPSAGSKRVPEHGLLRCPLALLGMLVGLVHPRTPSHPPQVTSSSYLETSEELVLDSTDADRTDPILGIKNKDKNYIELQKYIKIGYIMLFSNLKSLLS